jgi:predicted tellurium resistance membrane protein TerC
MDQLLTLAADPAAWAALATLIAMEIVLGIDNLIFVAILTNNLPQEHRAQARRIGIGLALILRLVLLGSVAIVVTLKEPLFTVMGHGFSWRDLILIAGADCSWCGRRRAKSITASMPCRGKNTPAPRSSP